MRDGAIRPENRIRAAGAPADKTGNVMSVVLVMFRLHHAQNLKQI